MFECNFGGNFVDESQYNYYIILDYIIFSNEINEKEIHITSKNLQTLEFWFRDYKSVLITCDQDYYFTFKFILVY